jgi:hypothetical protein
MFDTFPSVQMAQLELFDGGTVRIKGKRGRETVCVVLADDACDANNVRMNKVRIANTSPVSPS